MPRRRKDIRPATEDVIGRRLREIRLRQGKTQEEIAEHLRITQTLVSHYERGRLRLHGALVAAFARALRVSADEILGLKDTNGGQVIQDRRFLRRLSKIDRLPKRAKQTLLGTIDSLIKSSAVE